MNFWILLQVLLNIVFLAVMALVWIKLNRPQKDDPRMSRGLQLLQSKIAVLEDLSDRTEVQAGQLTSLLESKCKEIQNKIFDAEDHIGKINQAIGKSMEVAKIFQDKIPHKEIIERQNTVKFVKAAKLAHQGYSPEQIASQVDLSMGEIEFIAKMNKEKLMISEEELPEWAREEDADSEDGGEREVTMKSRGVRDLSSLFEAPQRDNSSLKKLGEEFRKACNTHKLDSDEPEEDTEHEVTTALRTAGPQLNFVEDDESDAPALEVSASPDQDLAKKVTAASEAPKKRIIESNDARTDAEPVPAKGKSSALERDVTIRPVEFKRIDLAKDLE